LAGCVDLVGLTVVDLVWRHQADATMVVILNYTNRRSCAQKVFASSMQAEPLRKLGLIF